MGLGIAGAHQGALASPESGEQFCVDATEAAVAENADHLAALGGFSDVLDD